MQKHATDSLLKKTVNSTNESGLSKTNQIQNIDMQVKPVKQKIYRRKFSKADKLKILAAFDACKDASERGALLRKEGLYYASITKWRLQLSAKNSSHANAKAHKLTLAHNQ